MKPTSLVIDADAHVEECDQTWDYLDPEFQDRRPIAVTLDDDKYRPAFGDANSFWLVDGKPTNKLVGKGAMVSLTPTTSRAARNKRFSVGSQQLTDIQARLGDMDQFGLAVQVLFPTVFNRPPTGDPRLATALHKSYNTWMAERCNKAPERLKWAAVMPLHQVDQAIEEFHRTRELGATVPVVYPLIDGRTLDDPLFYPFFAEVDRAESPVAVHIGWYFPEMTNLYDNIFSATIVSCTFPLLMSFVSVVGSNLLERFSRIRFAFLEGGASWMLYLAEHMDHYTEVNRKQKWWAPSRKAAEWMRSGRIYVTFEPGEALLPQVIEKLGEDHVLISTDMPHSEGRENSVEELWRREDVSEIIKRKICYDNPKRFYNL